MNDQAKSENSQKTDSSSNTYVTNSGAGIKKLPVEAMETPANKRYFDAVFERAKKRIKENTSLTTKLLKD